MIYAILNSEGKCINRTVWDGQSDWQPPEGCTAVADPDNLHPIDSSSSAPEAEPAPVLTTEQKLESAGLTVAELKELFGLA